MIGNDRLTVANLNRIKMLEAQLDEERQANEELARENDELRGRPSAEKVDALQEMLGEREQQARAARNSARNSSARNSCRAIL